MSVYCAPYIVVKLPSACQHHHLFQWLFSVATVIAGQFYAFPINVLAWSPSGNFTPVPFSLCILAANKESLTRFIDAVSLLPAVPWGAACASLLIFFVPWTLLFFHFRHFMPKVRCFLQKILLLVRHVNLPLIGHEVSTLIYYIQKSLLSTCYSSRTSASQGSP